MNYELYDAIGNITNLLIAIFGFIAIIFIVVVIGYGYIVSKKAEIKYKINVIEAISEKNNIDNINKLENAYSIYKKRSRSFRYYGIIEINQKIVEEIRIGDVKKYYKKELTNTVKMVEKLELAIKTLEGKIRFDDDKANEIYENLYNIVSDDKRSLIRDLKDYMLKTNSFYKGRIYEKENRIAELESKIKKQTWMNTIITILTVIASITSLVQFFS